MTEFEAKQEEETGLKRKNLFDDVPQNEEPKRPKLISMSEDDRVLNETLGDKPAIVRVRGLPWSTQQEDLLHFFEGVDVKSTHLTYNRDGRASGEAYLVLQTEDEIEKAVAKDKQHLMGRYVEVFKAGKQELLHVLGQQKKRDPQSGCVVKLRGLPFNCTEEEIKEFFHGLRERLLYNLVITPAQNKRSQEIIRILDTGPLSLFELPPVGQGPRGGPYGGYGPRGGFRGGPRGGPGFGPRGPGGFRGGPRGGFGGYRGGFGGGPGGPPPWAMGGGYDMGGWGGDNGMPMENVGNVGTKFVHIRGLPFRATEDDIYEFFQGLSVVNMDFLFTPDGRATEAPVGGARVSGTSAGAYTSGRGAGDGGGSRGRGRGAGRGGGGQQNQNFASDDFSRISRLVGVRPGMEIGGNNRCLKGQTQLHNSSTRNYWNYWNQYYSYWQQSQQGAAQPQMASVSNIPTPGETSNGAQGSYYAAPQGGRGGAPSYAVPVQSSVSGYGSYAPK